jgi:Flp pilus assembly protein TadD
VAWVSESKSTLAFLFFLLSFWFFIRMRERERWGWPEGVLSALFLILSLLAKINTVVAPAVFLLYDYKQGATLKTLRWRSLLPFFAISGLFVLIHLRAFHGSAESMEGVYYGGFWLHFMHLPLLLAFYADMTVFPYAVSAWEMFPIQSSFNALIALGWAGLAAVVFLLSRASRSIQFWALWFFVFLLPVLQIIPFPIWVADRYLYIPLVGGLVLVSRFCLAALQRMASPWPRWAMQGAMLGAVLLLAWKTHAQLPVWRDDLSLWSATTPTCDTSSYCHLNLALALLRNGQRELGVQHMLRAVEIRPSWRVLERLGDVYTLTLRDYRQAQIAYHMALEQTGPKGSPEIYGRIARAYYLAGDLEETTRVLEAGKRNNPNDLGLWIIDGFVRWRQGNLDEARSSLRRAVAMTGGSVNPAQFFTEFLGNPREVGRMLSSLRSSEAVAMP